MSVKYRQQSCFCKRKHRYSWDADKCKMLERDHVHKFNFVTVVSSKYKYPSCACGAKEKKDGDAAKGTARAYDKASIPKTFNLAI